jgi:hypothetical protein
MQLRIILKTEMAEDESAGVIGPTRLPASRVASSYGCNRCEPESLVEPSTTPSSSLSIPVSRIMKVRLDKYMMGHIMALVVHHVGQRRCEVDDDDEGEGCWDFPEGPVEDKAGGNHAKAQSCVVM